MAAAANAEVRHSIPSERGRRRESGQKVFPKRGTTAGVLAAVVLTVMGAIVHDSQGAERVRVQASAGGPVQVPGAQTLSSSGDGDPVAPTPTLGNRAAPDPGSAAPPDPRSPDGAAPSSVAVSDPPLQVAPPGSPAPVVALPMAKVGPVSQRCAAALVAVQAAGLLLHEGTAFRCPGSTETFPGDVQHWGVACWEHKHFCATGSYIAANTDEIGASNHSLRYVVAHEICHINSYLATGGPGTEDAADLCAEQAGFPR